MKARLPQRLRPGSEPPSLQVLPLEVSGMCLLTQVFMNLFFTYYVPKIMSRRSRNPQARLGKGGEGGVHVLKPQGSEKRGVGGGTHISKYGPVSALGEMIIHSSCA